MKTSENKCMSFLTISNYIFKLTLPKCNMVLGPYVSSVYFQIFINICHDNTIELWKYNKCWLSQETMAKNLKSTRMTVNKMISHLIDLGLIKKGKHLNHNTYELCNDNLNESELIQFNIDVENKLLAIAQKLNKDCAKIKRKFNELDLEVAYHSNSVFKFVKKTKLVNTNKIRNTLKRIEQDNNGITLFYINNVLFPNNHLQKYRALRSGITQSTISNYMKYSIQHNLLELEDKKMYVQKKKRNLEQVKCPICGKLCASKGYLLNHLSKTQDTTHQALYSLYKKSSDKDVLDTYENNKDTLPKQEPSYKDVYCEKCNGNCKLCYKEWKDEYFEQCQEQRKILFIKQEEKFIKNIDKQKNKKQKKPNPNSTPNLVKYFYSKTNTQSPGFARECNQVKILLKRQYTPEQIKLTMDYLIKRKNIDLRFLNRSIEEAILEKKYKDDIKIKDSASYLVKLFHKSTKVILNSFSFINEVNKIQTMLDDGYTPLQIKQTMKYMILKDIKTFNFLPNMIDEAILFFKDKEPTNDKLKVIHDDLKYNISDLTQIKQQYYQEGEKFARQFYSNKSYSEQLYTKFEYAYKVKLNLDKDLIQDGIKDKQQNKWGFRRMYNGINEDDFFVWLKNQFKQNKIDFNILQIE